MHDRKTGRFLPGVSGNPAGRRKGSRNKLPECFFDDLYADWGKHGAAAIRQMREDRPRDYVVAVIAALPKDVRIKHRADMTDDELSRRIRQLAAELDLALVPAQEPRAR